MIPLRQTKNMDLFLLMWCNWSAR